MMELFYGEAYRSLRIIFILFLFTGGLQLPLGYHYRGAFRSHWGIFIFYDMGGLPLPYLCEGWGVRVHFLFQNRVKH